MIEPHSQEHRLKNRSIFGNKIREARENLNLSISELADKINVSFETMCLLENGVREPSICVLKALAWVFFISIDQLLGWEDTTDLLISKDGRELMRIYSTLNERDRLTLVAIAAAFSNTMSKSGTDL